MMIKANGQYLDFTGDIEIESQVKLFEEIATSNGDYSYDIAIQDNAQNRKILGIPRADIVKTIYQTVPSEIIDDTGQSIYTGKLQVNRVEGGFISSTFFSGNTEWFNELSEPMSSLPLYRYDVDLTEANIQASWISDDGIVFPIMDTGALVTRSFSNLKVEDFTAGFYVKTLFNEIFNPKGIKVDGDFVEDATFKKLIVASNRKSQDETDARSSYAKSTSDQSIPVFETIKFQDESTFPYYDGGQNNYNNVTGEYTADVKMRANVSVNLNIRYTLLSSPPLITIAVNSVAIKQVFANSAQMYVSADASLNAGDILTVILSNTGGTVDAVLGSTLKIKPIFIYKSFGVSSVPGWSQVQFVSNILRLFNVLPSYNPISKTLTLDLFNNIKNKPYVDISNEVTIDTVDFSEFVSSYAKNNYFKYQESEDEDLRQYNISNFISYGSGDIVIDNDYIDDEADTVESDFTSPITYLNGVFDMSMERINFVELEESTDRPITSIDDPGSGRAAIKITNANTYFSVGDLVRIDSTDDSYNGEWVIDAVASGSITVNGLFYNTGAATGTATLLRHKFTTDDSVYIFVNVPNVTNTFFTSKASINLGGSTTFTSSAIAYFNLLSNGTPINKVYKQSLSFGSVNNPTSYQLSLIDTYWPLFSRILNDPVSLIGSGNLKRTTFDKIKTFLRPVMVQTEETRNLYYVNRNRGYKGSERPCELQLIKLN